MNPRKILECTDSLEVLPVDQAWLTGYTEADLPVNHIVRHTDYDRYSIISDDAIVTPEALAAVLAAHDAHPDAVVTGYSRLAQDDERVNLTAEPMIGSEIRLMSRDQVRQQPPVFPTYFAGYAFTTATRQVWLNCPFPARGNANDAAQTQLFGRAGLEILAVRDGEVQHVKERWNQGDQDPKKALWVGLIPAEIRWRIHDS